MGGYSIYRVVRILCVLLLLIIVVSSCVELERVNPNDPFFVLEAPTNLELLVLSDSEIQVSWNDNSDVEEGFLLERDQGDGYIKLVEVDANETVYTDTGLTLGQSYSYRVAGYSGVSPNAKFNQYDFGQNVLDAPEPYYNERNGWRDPQLGNG